MGLTNGWLHKPLYNIILPLWGVLTSVGGTKSEMEGGKQENKHYIISQNMGLTAGTVLIVAVSVWKMPFRIY